MRAAALFASMILAGCHLFYPFDVVDDGGAGDVSDLSLDNRDGVDLAPTDIGSDTATDIGSDTAVGCSGTGDLNTVALYLFDEPGGNTFASSVIGAPDGQLTAGVQRVAGPPGCGNALGFPQTQLDASTNTSVFASLPAASMFRLPVGSVDLFVRLDDSTARGGIVSIDAGGNGEGGHLTLARVGAHFSARIQDKTTTWMICSEAVTIGTWHHVAVNFGKSGVELWVDGKRAQATGFSMPGGSGDYPCEATGGSVGLDKNINPWVLGATAAWSSEGQNDKIKFGLGGAIDQLRISDVWRNFAAP